MVRSAGTFVNFGFSRLFSFYLIFSLLQVKDWRWIHDGNGEYW